MCHRTWEWAPQYQLRSFISVLPYAAIMSLLEQLVTIGTYVSLEDAANHSYW